MTKRELIDDIMSLNPSAEPGFLADFSAEDLQRYLDKLIWIQEPRGESARGFFREEAPALRTEAVATALADHPYEPAETGDRLAEHIERVTGKWLPHAQFDADEEEPGMAMLDIQTAEKDLETDSRQPQTASAGAVDAWLF
jgi:ParB-like chromosome segregation protein Spo0J